MRRSANGKTGGVKLQLPLFSGYVFVRIARQNRLTVLQAPGVARLVSFAGRAVPVPEEELQRIRTLVAIGIAARPHPYLGVGKPVRVKSGPLAGFEGTVVRRKNLTRFVLSIHLLQRSIVLDIDSVELEPLVQSSAPPGLTATHG
jgi:transcription antitermination factor NusG